MQTSSFAIQETQVYVLATGDTPQAVANARGHLFEVFVARILQQYGFEEPKVENLNVTSDGIELDVVVRHHLTRRIAMAECKAYTSPVKAKELVAFYGKLCTERLVTGTDIDGFFFALPRITQQGVEKSQAIEKNDAKFRYLNAESVSAVALKSGLISPIPDELTDIPTSDPAIIITGHGVYSALKALHPDTRTASEVIAWSANGTVPEPALSLIRNSEYASGASVRDVRHRAGQANEKSEPTPIVVEVRGSESDFEYQLPASPQYFVGRSKVLSEVEGIIKAGSAVVVVNAQSGWGKSSLALRLKQTATRHGGMCLVFDTRTASHVSYVSQALRKAAIQAEAQGLMTLPSGASWASLASSLETLHAADWKAGAGPVLVFFDQFENVFRDELLTREFRDLALGIREVKSPLSVGFAWKTDLVGWTESHPYRLRDEIRSNARVIHLDPFGPGEVDTLLRKLERNLDATLVRDLKERIREYSQGLPWLFKKLAGHVLSEVKDGVSQAQLVSEALNVQSLFERDLAELTPGEREGLSQIARYAPIAVSEAMERIPAEVVQSLLDRRLIVQVGEKLDTYWDTFRDFLVNGTVPIEDSFILRQVPTSVGRLVSEVIELGGDVAVVDLAERLSISEAVVYNLSRELRQFGTLAYEPTRIRTVDEFSQAADHEEFLRNKVAISLRRHRAHSTLVRLLEQDGGQISLATFTAALPSTFPAVAASEKTWANYARAFAQWFEYAGIVHLENQTLRLLDETEHPTISIIGAERSATARGVFPKSTPGPALALLTRLAQGEEIAAGGRSAAELLLLGAVRADGSGRLQLTEDAPVDGEGQLNQDELLALMMRHPGIPEALEALKADPQASQELVGGLIRDAVHVDWAPATVALIGKQVRGWLKAAGVPVKRLPV